ncbi:MAG: hypothetical protein K2W96_28405 [Gemmataceae bacterium]|nr:hypothetical protein [Gemmataceae bacterium]
MPQQTYDPGSKWLIGDRGPSLLWVAGLRDVLSCEADQAEVVLPRKMPDGLMRARMAGRRDPVPVLLEIATYAEERVVEQVCGDLRLVRQVKGVLPETVVMCLAPKGSYRVPDHGEAESVLGLTRERFSWRVVNLWEMEAKDLLEAPDVGAVPWATLAKWDGPPEVLLQRCKDRIVAEGRERRESLLAVTQVFAKMHFDTPELLAILGERSMILRDMPAIQEIVTESEIAGQMKATLAVLHRRFGKPGPDIEAGLALVKTEAGLIDLIYHAGTCTTLSAFEKELRRHLPQPRPASTRGKRKKGE